jgi:hypothetical protein
MAALPPRVSAAARSAELGGPRRQYRSPDNLAWAIIEWLFGLGLLVSLAQDPSPGRGVAGDGSAWGIAVSLLPETGRRSWRRAVRCSTPAC